MKPQPAAGGASSPVGSPDVPVDNLDIPVAASTATLVPAAASTAAEGIDSEFG